MTPDQIKFTLGIALACLLVYGGWVMRGWKDDSVKLAIEQATQQSRDASAQAAADAIAKIPAPKVYVGTSKSKVYTDCQNTDEVWNEFVKGFK
jgi:hypothetical protein